MNAEQPYILLAEDDPDDQYAFSELILRLDPHVSLQIVQDGQELMDFLDVCPDSRLPMIMVFDYKMPNLTGADVLRYLAVCHRFKHIPKIIWSTSSREKEIAECLGLGAAHYFLKPATNQELENFIVGLNTFVFEQFQKITI